MTLKPSNKQVCKLELAYFDRLHEQWRLSKGQWRAKMESHSDAHLCGDDPAPVLSKICRIDWVKLHGYLDIITIPMNFSQWMCLRIVPRVSTLVPFIVQVLLLFKTQACSFISQRKSVALSNQERFLRRSTVPSSLSDVALKCEVHNTGG